MNLDTVRLTVRDLMAHSLKAGTPPGETGRAGPDNRTLNSHGLAVRKSACAGEYLLQSET